MATAKKAAKVTPAKKAAKTASKGVKRTAAPAVTKPAPVVTKPATPKPTAPAAPAPEVTIASFKNKPRTPAELKADGFTHHTIVQQRELSTGKTSTFTLDTRRELRPFEMKARHDAGCEMVDYKTVKL